MSILLRYRSLRGQMAYGEAVEKLFRTIEDQLNRSPPSRSGYLRLIKEIADFFFAEKTAATTSAKIS